MTTAPTPDAAVRRPLPSAALTAFGLGGCWTALAVAETVVGDLDSLDSAAAWAEGRGRLVAAGLLHTTAGFLVALGLVGVAGRAWTSFMGRLGLALSALLAPALGGFGMLHLLAADLGEEVLEEQPGLGAWEIPVLVVAVPGMFLLTLLLAGLARSGDVPWWPVAVAGAGAVLHAVNGTGITEIAAHWLLAAALVVAAGAFLRRGAAVS